MESLTAIAAPALLVAGSLGAGSALLAWLRVPERGRAVEHWAWSFALGFGLLGWLLFFVAAAGFAAPLPMAVVAAVCACGLFVPDAGRPRRSYVPFSSVERAAFSLLAAILAIAVFEALSPPTDADSLAYHFALPKLFLEAGRLVFVPRAIDGAVPLLPQMTYMAALGIGGERAMTVWVMLTGWGAAAVVYAAARRYLDRLHATLLAAAFYTVPAVLYGAGSGQAEVKLSMFALMAAAALVRAMRTDDARLCILAGLGAGFFIGGKFTGLLFAACCLAVILCGRSRLRLGAAFAAASFVAGCQWLLWNWGHTGDPTFPMLYRWLGADPAIWTASHDAYFRAAWNAGETPLARTPWNLLAYPALATFLPLPAFDAGRTGFGPLPALLIPFAAVVAWRARRDIARSELWAMAAVCLLFYVAWFLIGPSQRLRHLLPLLPIAMVVLAASARRWAAEAGCGAAVALALGATIAIQGAGEIVYAKRYVERAVGGESRESFLARSVAGYPAVSWVNAHLAKDSRVTTDIRQLVYLLNVPAFYAHPVDQAQLDLSPAGRVDDFLTRARRLGITHVVAVRSGGRPSEAGLSRLAEAALAEGCGSVAAEVPIPVIASRTLAAPRDAGETAAIIQLSGPNCAQRPS